MHVRKRVYATAVAAIALTTVPFLVGATSGGAKNTARTANPACGSTITTSVILTADMSCPGEFGIIVGHDAVIINLNGHTISGDGTHTGIVVGNNNSITVENGVISNFGTDITIAGTSKAAHVINMRVMNAANVGVNASSAGSTIVSGSWFIDDGTGIAVSAEPNDQLTRNVLEGNTDEGIVALNTPSITVTGNVATDNALVGIQVFGTGTVSANVVNSNTQLGLELTSDPPGVKPTLTATGNRAAFNGTLGIKADAGTVVDGGANVVQDNGTAAQCANIACHAVSS